MNRIMTLVGVAGLGLVAVAVGCETTGLVGGGAGGALAASEGAGCLDAPPAGLPYQPGCCDHTVYVPDGVEAGFSSAVLGANPIPDHVHASWAGPTPSSFAVNWRTDNGTLATELLYGTSEADVQAASAPGGTVKRVTGHHMLYGSLLDGAQRTRVHEVHVCGLDASKVYYYKVGGPGAWSPVYDFATGPAIGATESFKFAVTGDSRDDPTTWAEVQQAVAAQAIDFQLFSGDAVVIGQNQAEWNGFFAASSGGFSTEGLFATSAFMVVNGNHDALSVNYVAQFAMPQDVSPGELAQGEEWYSFDYGNAHFVALNDTPAATATGQPQVDWLRADLAAVDRQKTPWIFAMHHRPTYSCGGSHGSDVALRSVYQPIFDQYRVDVVFSGHDHFYERSVPIRGMQGTEGQIAASGPNAVPVSESGTLYVVAAGAGAPLYGVDTSCYFVHTGESERNFVIVTVQDRTLQYRALRLNGTLLDQFDYTK
ncbi:MAG: metallophosphoesterase family protein [Myxococcales bacterium]|nr:metallophosphoesterase family protein [Myxococcales bacterium]